MKIKEEYRRYIMWAAIGVLYIICFKLVLNSGYMYDDMWSYPSPQIFNEELYLKNKVNYDNAVKEFRISCEVV